MKKKFWKFFHYFLKKKFLSMKKKLFFSKKKNKMFFTVSLPIFIHFWRLYPRGGTADSARTTNSAPPRTWIWRGHGLLKILKHKYLTFLRVGNAGVTSKHCYRSYSKVPPKEERRVPPRGKSARVGFGRPKGAPL